MPWQLAGYENLGHELSIDCAQLTRAHCDRLAGFADHSGLIEYGSAREHWMELYPLTRNLRGNEQWIPDDMQAFISQTNYKEWPGLSVQSRIKNAKRVIYHGYLDQRRISVAETWQEGESQFRELEIAFEAKRARGTFDFYVYDHHGQLANESEFPAGMRPAPVICAACHMNRTTGKTSKFIRNRRSE